MKLRLALIAILTMNLADEHRKKITDCISV